MAVGLQPTNPSKIPHPGPQAPTKTSQRTTAHQIPQKARAENTTRNTKIQKVILKALKVKLSIKYISKNYYIQKKELYFNHLSIR